MLTVIRWLVKHWLPGWSLMASDERELYEIMKTTWEPPIAVLPNSGRHYRKGGLVRNPTRKPKPVAVFDDGELTWKEEENG
jgi:hypothetical protein